MTFSQRAVEAAARAMVLLAKERHDAGACLPSRLEEAKVALTAALAVDGLCLVPVEPTQDMIGAGSIQFLTYKHGASHNAVPAIWSAMLSAASAGTEG